MPRIHQSIHFFSDNITIKYMLCISNGSHNVQNCLECGQLLPESIPQHCTCVASYPGLLSPVLILHASDKHWGEKAWVPGMRFVHVYMYMCVNIHY